MNEQSVRGTRYDEAIAMSRQQPGRIQDFYLHCFEGGFYGSFPRIMKGDIKKPKSQITLSFKIQYPDVDETYQDTYRLEGVGNILLTTEKFIGYTFVSRKTVKREAKTMWKQEW